MKRKERTNKEDDMKSRKQRSGIYEQTKDSQDKWGATAMQSNQFRPKEK